MKTKNLIRILGILIIIIIISFIAIIIIKNNQKNKQNDFEISDKPYNRADFFDDDIEYVAEDVIIPDNSYLFFGEYINGRVESKEIYESIDKFAKKIVPKFYNELKDLDDAEIANYFENNKSGINKYLEIESDQDFVNFVKQIKKLKSDNLEVTGIEFVKDTMKYMNEYTISELKITYNDDEVVSVTVKVFRRIQESNRNVVFY